MITKADLKKEHTEWAKRHEEDFGTQYSQGPIKEVYSVEDISKETGVKGLSAIQKVLTWVSEKRSTFYEINTNVTLKDDKGKIVQDVKATLYQAHGPPWHRITCSCGAELIVKQLF